MGGRDAHDDLPEGLTHNPFAALRPEGASPAPPSSSASDETPRKDGADPDRADEEPTGRLVVRREKRGRGGKTVTRIAGLELADGALADLSRDMKRALGCGASVEEGDILLQGALVERAATWLEERFGVRVTRGN